MNFDLVKKNAAYKRFASDVEKNVVSHAYLVYGEDGELRDSFFKLAAMKLLCPTACGECATCTQILEGNYVELFKADGKEKISVSDVRELLEKLYVKCVVGERKICVIDNAELLSPEVQNKLLKTYEEPPENLTIFLGAAHESGLLATLRSRGKKLYLEDLSAKDVAAELTSDGEDPLTAEAAAAFSMGNYEKAEKFCREKEYRELYEKTFLMMAELKKSQQVPEYVCGGLFEKETVKTTLDFMEIILCDVMKRASGSDAPLFTVNREYDLGRASEGYTAESAAAAVAAVNEARKKLASNVNLYSAAGCMLMEILEAKYKWRKK